MAAISAKYEGLVSFTQDGKVNLPDKTVGSIHLAITLLGMRKPQEITTAKQLRSSFHSVLPSFNSSEVLKQSIIEKKAETAEQILRDLGFLKPVNKMTVHPLRNKVRHIYEKENNHQLPIETKLVSIWLQFLQGRVEEKQNPSPLNYLMLADLIQTNYLIQVKRLVSQLSLKSEYPELQKAHRLLLSIGNLLLNPYILYSQPYKQIAEKLQQGIANIKDPGTCFYNPQYSADIQKVIEEFTDWYSILVL